MKDDRLYLAHMSECIASIEEYTRDGREAFIASKLVRDGVLRNLQVMAESSQRVSDALKAEHPEIDWRAISGFRNVLVHDYLDVDPDIVWNVVQGDLPTLKRQVDSVLARLGS